MTVSGRIGGGGRPLSSCDSSARPLAVGHSGGDSLAGLADLGPEALPSAGAPERWPWLQALRRRPTLDLEPWLHAIETGRLQPAADLFAALAERLDPPACRRLLAWWLTCPQADPALLQVIGRPRDPHLAAQLRTALLGSSPEQARWLLPLLGHQRAPADFPLLRAWVAGSHPALCRRAALEGLAVGLPCWPQPELRTLLRRLLSDLDPGLAATAVDLLARLPQPRRVLAAASAHALDAAVQARRLRRLSLLPANPLVLVVHGRGGGVIPAELEALREELECRRRMPVLLQVLTAETGPDADALRRAAAGRPLSLMPLLLLPGGHVRRDVPALAAAWRRSGPVCRLPFLGAWPAWQQALREELAAAAAAHPGARPLLLHHPLQEGPGHSYLAHLARVCGGTPHAAAYSAADSADSQELQALLQAPERPAVLPLVLAANRLTESLPPWCGVPLLQRPRFRDCVMDLLASLP